MEPGNEPARRLGELGQRVLRESGHKLTPQRSAVLELFNGSVGHWTAQQIYLELEGCQPSLSLATVYNTLEIFEELGLLRRFALPDGQTTFDRNTTQHHHAICVECDEILDVSIPDDTLSALLDADPALEFEVRNASVWYRGVCRTCSNCQS